MPKKDGSNSKLIAIISGVASAVAGFAIPHIFGWWPAIRKWLHGKIIWLSQSTELSNWLITVLAIATATLILVTCRAAHSRFSISRTPEWMPYTKDTFLGMKWRWHMSTSGTPHNLSPFCPICDYELSGYHASAFRAVDRTGFYCDSCERSITEIDGTADAIASKVTRLIQQKIRTKAEDATI